MLQFTKLFVFSHCFLLSFLFIACTPGDSENQCAVFDGAMNMYLEEDADTDAATYATLKKIQDLMTRVDGTASPGVIKATYLGPSLVDPSEAKGVKSDTNDVDTGSNGLSAGYGVLIALSGVVVVAAVVATYRRRRQSDEGKDLGALTVAAGSEVTGDTSMLSGSAVNTTAFSSMLPSSYRLEQDSQMSAIMEAESDLGSTDQSELILSECGYTTDGDTISNQSLTQDQSFLKSLHDAPSTLGARRYEEEEDDDDFIFDTGSQAGYDSQRE